MWKTVLFLIFTLIAVPIISFMYDEPLNDLQTHTLFILLWVYGITTLLCFIISTVTDNYSQVDKVWSIIPVPYTWIIAYHSDFDSRIVIMAILVTVWALRLSYNFGRRGGYSWKFWTGEEDYRWKIVRAKPEFNPNWKWVLFNLFFTSMYQMGLILLFTLPALKAMQSEVQLNSFDFILAGIIVFLIIIEYIADEQQYIYQLNKHERLKNGEELDYYYKLGFTHTGLWAFMRHPNYSAEQGIWIVFYLFSVVASGQWINWSIAGCLLLVLLFKGSSDFSEDISKEKYPEYSRYIKEVGRFLPTKRKFKT